MTLRRGAGVVLAETPTNPGLDVVDLHRPAMICGAAARRWSSRTPPRRRSVSSRGMSIEVAEAVHAWSRAAT
jgi:cystathionine gamma-lyase